MTEVETGTLAVRLLSVSALVLLAPGFAFLSALRVPAEWPERIVLAFSSSYAWMFILSIVVPLLGWTVDRAALATACLIAVLAGVAAIGRWRQGTGVVAERPGATTFVLIAVIVGAGMAGWAIEAPFTGEEALDFTSLSRVADGGPITFDNISLLPNARSVYLFQPYQLALGMISRWSGTDPLIAFVKFRAFLIPLCLVCIYAFLRRSTLTRADALAAFIVVVLSVALEIETWETNFLFPFVSRKPFTAGALIPSLLVLCLIATRRVQDAGARLARRVALGVTPVMLVAALSTHSVEVVTFLCFAGAAMVATVIGLDRGGDRRQALVIMLSLAVAAGAYLAVHTRAVSYVAGPVLNSRFNVGARLYQALIDPGGEVARQAAAAPDLLVGGSTPLTTAAVIGLPALAFAALRTPAAAAVLVLGTIPLGLLYAHPAGYLAVRFLVFPYSIREVQAYFMLMGMLGAALGLVALAHGVLHAAAWRRQPFGRVAVGVLVLALVVIAGREVVPWLGNAASLRPEFFLLVEAALGAVALAIAAIRPRPLLSAPSPYGVVMLAACLAVPLAVPGLVFGGVFERGNNASVFSRFMQADSRPSAFDWPAYYGELTQTIRPPLPVPRAVVDELRRRLPPRQILLAHPSYSCALVVLLDAYCINPERIYGDYFRPAGRYLGDYVRWTKGQPPEHPFYNASPELSSAEGRLLTDYRVSHVLADPEHAELIARKLEETTVGATLEADVDGYRLYRIGGP